jgi:hypothetical protein
MNRVGVTGHQVLPHDARSLLSDRLELLFPMETGPSLLAVSSLARGPDQTFAAHSLLVGGRLLAVIPCERYEETFQDRTDLERYRHLLSLASDVKHLPYGEPSEEAFYAAGRRVVEESDWIIAVWDGEPARGLGGTADVVAFARDLNRKVEVIWPAGVRRLS